MSSRVPALVIGAGISGLTCAYALHKAGIEAQVIEASERAGGVIRSERSDAFLFELGPQSFSGTAALRALCNKLAIENELVEAPPRAPRYILVNGALQAVPLSLPAMLTSSLLSLSTKWAVARDVLGRTQPPSEDESIGSFVRRKFGAELLERLVAPFVSGIYAGDPERLSVRSAFPELYEAEKSAGSVIRGMMRAAKRREGPRERPALFSFRDGNETLTIALAAKLGSALRVGTLAHRVERKTAGQESFFEITVGRADQMETIAVDRLIIATPADVAGTLLSNIHPSFGSLLCSIEYAPVAVVSLGYRREDVGHSLAGFRVLIPRSAGLRALGTVWNSSLFAGRAPAGYMMLTSFVGGATDPQAAQLAPQSLVNLIHGEMAPVLNIARPPVCSNVQIHRRALPQYNLGHGERLAAVETLRRAIPNLFLAGNYLCGPSIGACVEQASAIAEHIYGPASESGRYQAPPQPQQ